MPDINITSGIFNTSQLPLDSKTYFKTLAELQSLGSGDFKAFYYYEDLIVYCLETKTNYKWREAQFTNEPGVISSSFTYPANSVVDGVDYSNRTFNFFEITENRLEDFGVFYSGQGLTYDCYADAYVIQNQSYSAPFTQVTLSPSPTTIGEFRLDLVVANTDGTITVVEGDESTDPLRPDINENTQRVIGEILLSDNITEPPTASNELIYNENVEWTTSTQNITNGSVDFESTTNPALDGVHIEAIDLAGSSRLIFENTTQSFPLAGLQSFRFQIQSNLADKKITLDIFNDNTQVRFGKTFTYGEYGFTQGTTYSTVNVPFEDFLIINDGNIRTEFDRIVITVRNVDSQSSELTTYNLDNITAVYAEGSDNDNPQSYLELEDTFDNTYARRFGFAPLVDNSETGLVLTPIPQFTDLYAGNAIINGGIIFEGGLSRTIW